MTDGPLVTLRTVNASRALRANQRQAKKDERPKRLFGLLDSDTKIYRLVRLSSDETLDMCGDSNSGTQADEGSRIVHEEGGLAGVAEFSAELPSDPEQILANIRAAHVVGMSGSGFPSIRKIETLLASPAKDKYLIVNGVECDPALIHDEWLLRNRWQEILAGIKVLQTCQHFAKVVVASRISFAAPGAQELGVTVEQVNSFYPMGEEHFLANKVLGVPLDCTQIPAQQGILVFNVQTVIMLGHAAVTGEALPYKYLTAANLLDGTARVVRAPVGIRAQKILLHAFGPSISKDAQAYMGSGAMGAHPIEAGSVGSMESKVQETTNAVLYARPIAFARPAACLGCGTCVKCCPLHLPMAGMVKLQDYGTPVPDDVRSACLSCNACSYFCKAGIDTAACVR